MPDITMCTGENCSLKETCYRNKATPCEYRQSYFIKPPYTINQERGEHSCELYWELKERK